MPNNIIAKHQRGNSEFVKNLPIVDGQKVYNTETGEEFLDIGKERVLRHKDIRKLVADNTDLIVRANETLQNLPGIHDDKVSKEELWSSDKTATELSKGLYHEVGPLTGEFIRISNAAGSMPIRAITEIPVVQEGSGDPSPENVRPIVMHDKVELVRCGKNLLSKLIVGNIHGYGNKLYRTWNGGWSGVIDASRFSGKTLVFTGLPMADIGWVGYSDVPPVANTQLYDVIGLTNEQSITIPLNPTHKYLVVTFVTSGNDPAPENCQIEIGSVATPYEPYTAETFTAQLPEPVAGGVVDWGKKELSKPWNVYTLTGEELWAGWGTGAYYSKPAPALVDFTGTPVCTELKFDPDMFSTGVGYGFSISHRGAIGLGIDFSTAHGITDAVSLSKYLKQQFSAGTPVQIAFIKPIASVLVTTSGSPSSLPGENNIYSNVGINTITAYEQFPSDFIRDYVVDLTCNKFEQKAPVVTCHPVPDYPIHVVSEIAVKQEGSGDPSLENVRPIVMHDKVELTRCGSNLLDVASGQYTANGKFVTQIKTGIHVDFNVGKNGRYLKFRVNLKPGTYVLSAESTEGIHLFLPEVSLYISWGAPFYVEQSITNLRIYTSDFAVLSKDITDIRLNISSVKPYTPYTGETYTAQLPEPVAGGVVDWNRKIAMQDFQVYQVNTDAGVTKIGDEEKTYGFAIGLYRFGESGKIDPDRYNEIVCNGLPTISRTIQNLDVPGVSPNYKPNYNQVFYVRVEKTVLSDGSVDSFVKWANSVNLEIGYPLLTPVELEVPTSGTPTSLPDRGENNLYSSTGDTTVSGYVDPVYNSKKKDDRITALEEQITQLLPPPTV